jgi:hypothetical protein
MRKILQELRPRKGIANCKTKIATGKRESKKILVRISSDTNIQMKELVESSSGWNGGNHPALSGGSDWNP